MSDSSTLEDNSFQFVSTDSFVYGTRITVLSKPELKDDKYYLYIFDSITRREVELIDNMPSGTNFIIMKCTPYNGRHHHIAVSVEAIEQNYREIEKQTTFMLRRGR